MVTASPPATYNLATPKPPFFRTSGAGFYETVCASAPRRTRPQTLTGPGGSGKTRLALAVASDVVGRFEDGVWLVEFAPLSDPDLVPQAVASVLGVRETPGVPLLETLAEHLGPRHTLLVFDDCEHLIDACASLAEALLRRCPNLSVLATSREALGVAGEILFAVPHLSLPDPHVTRKFEEHVAGFVR